MAQVLAQSAELRGQHEEESRRARELSDALKDRDQAVLKHLCKQKTEKRVVDTLKVFFDTDRGEREVLGKQDAVLDITSEVRSELHTLLRGEMET